MWTGHLDSVTVKLFPGIETVGIKKLDWTSSIKIDRRSPSRRRNIPPNDTLHNDTQNDEKAQQYSA